MLTFLLLAPGLSPSGKTDYAFEVDLIINSFFNIYFCMNNIWLPDLRCTCRIFIAASGIFFLVVAYKLLVLTYGI